MLFDGKLPNYTLHKLKLNFKKVIFFIRITHFKIEENRIIFYIITKDYLYFLTLIIFLRTYAIGSLIFFLLEKNIITYEIMFEFPVSVLVFYHGK